MNNQQGNGLLEIQDELISWLKVLARECKSCFMKSRCNLCASNTAKYFLEKISFDKSIFQEKDYPYKDRVSYSEALETAMMCMKDDVWYKAKDIVTPYINEKKKKQQFLNWCERKSKLEVLRGENGLRMFKKPRKK